MVATSTCPECGKRLKVEERLVGRLCRCPACKKQFTVSTVAFPGAASIEPSVEASETINSATDAHQRTEGGTAARPREPLGRLGRFEIREVLGQGGFGTVYRAYDPVLERDVALKVPKFTAEEERKVARFLREAKAAARLNHPNIATVYDAGEEGGSPYFVMEYVTGTDLGSLVRKSGPLSVDMAVNYVIQAARGLGHAHTLGTVHRDIKPSNLMLDAGGAVKILDMGLARVSRMAVEGDDPDHSLTRSGQMMGTVDYMAPEQAVDARTADHRADIYSLGCTLWTLLTGRAMFESDSLVGRILAHRESPVPSLSSHCTALPAGLDGVLKRMVAKKPEQRIDSMAEVIRELEACLAGGAATVGREASLFDDLSEIPDTPRSNLAPQPSANATTKSFVARLPPRWIVLIGGGLLGLVLIGIALAVVLRFRTSEGVVVVEVNQPDAQVEIDGGKYKITTPDGKEPVQFQVDEGKHTLQVTKGGFESYTREFVISSGGKETIRVELEPDVQGAPRKTDPQTAAIQQSDSHEPNAAPESKRPANLDVSERKEGTPLKGVKLTDWSPNRSARKAGDGRLVYWSGGDPQTEFSDDGKHLVVLTNTCLAHTWDAVDGRLLDLVQGVGVRLTLGPGGRLAVSQDADKIYVWRVENGETVLRIDNRPFACAAISPDERHLFAAYSTGRIELISLETGKAIRVVRETGVAGTAAKYSPSGRLLAMIDARGGQSLFDTTSWQVVHRLSDASELPGSAKRIAFSEPLNRIAFTGDREIRLWDMSAGSVIGRIDAPTPELFGGMATDPKGQLMVAGLSSGKLLCFSPYQGKSVQQTERHVVTWIVDACFSRDGRQLAVAGHFSVALFEAGTLRVIAKPTIGISVSSLRFSPDGKGVFGGADGLLFWELASNHWLLLPDAPISLITVLNVAPDGGRVLCQNRGTIGVFDARTGRSLESIRACPEGESLRHVATSRNGVILASVSSGRQVSLWNLTNRQQLPPTWTVKPDIQAIDLDAAGRRLAIATADGALTVYDTSKGTPTHTFARPSNVDGFVALDPKGRLIAARGPNGAVLRWNLESGQPLPSLCEAARRIAFSDDGSLLAIADDHEHVRIYNTLTDQQIDDLVVGPNVPETMVSSMAFSPDNHNIATGNNNGTIYLFQIANRGSEAPTVGGNGHLGTLEQPTERRQSKPPAAGSRGSANTRWQLPSGAPPPAIAPFCAWLSEKEGEQSHLPSEAQWEYACRAGTTTTWYSCDDSESEKKYGWFNSNADGKTHRTGRIWPNAWGLYDVHGNVWEWCQDWYGECYYAASPMDDPPGASGGSDRVSRGGCFGVDAFFGRASFRHWAGPGFCSVDVGCRLARVVSSASR